MKFFDKCDGEVLGDKWYCSAICFEYAVNKENKLKMTENNVERNKENNKSYLNTKYDTPNNPEDDDYDPMLDF